MLRRSFKYLFLPIFLTITVHACSSGGSKNSGGKKDGSTSPTPTSGPQVEGNLAPYLVTYAQADAIKQLVEAYMNPTMDKGTYPTTQEYGNFKNFISTFLARLMAINTLSPGRNFNVLVIDDDTENAFADPHQQVGINKVVFKSMKGSFVLPVLCHEIAHSGLNHGEKRYEWMKQNKDIVEAYDYADAYLRLTYDETTKKYKHKLASYQSALANWQKVSPKIGIYRKTSESQADVVGGMICGQAGMSAADFRAGIIGFLRKASASEGGGSTTTAKDLKDGDTFGGVDGSDLFEFLFDSDSHPTDGERDTQLARLATPIGKFYQSNTMANEWNQTYGSMGGLSLVDEPIAPKSFVTDFGAKIILKKRQCN